MILEKIVAHAAPSTSGETYRHGHLQLGQGNFREKFDSVQAPGQHFAVQRQERADKGYALFFQLADIA